MRRVFHVHKCDFTELSQVVVENDCDPPECRVNFTFTDPPYNIREYRANSNVNSDVLIESDMWWPS